MVLVDINLDWISKRNAIENELDSHTEILVNAIETHYQQLSGIDLIDAISLYRWIDVNVVEIEDILEDEMFTVLAHQVLVKLKLLNIDISDDIKNLKDILENTILEEGYLDSDTEGIEGDTGDEYEDDEVIYEEDV